MWVAPATWLSAHSSLRRTSRTTGPGLRVEAVGQIAELGQPDGGQRPPARPVRGPPTRRGGQPVDADPGQLSLGVGHLVRRFAEQGHRRAPRHRPAHVGGEAVAQGEADRPGTKPAANAIRSRRSITHSPASMRRRISLRTGRLRRGQIRARPARPGWPGPCARSTRARRPGLPAACPGRSAGSASARDSPASRGRSWTPSALALAGRAEAAEPVGREDRGGVGQFPGEALGRGVLCPGERPVFPGPSRSGRPVAP